MKKIYVYRQVITLLMFGCIMNNCWSNVQGKLRSREVKEFPKRPHAFLKEKTYKELNKGQALMSKNKEDEALEVFLKLDEQTKDKPKENPQVKILLGYIYGNKGLYDKGIKAFEDALKAETLTAAQSLSVLAGLAQFHTFKKNYAKSNEVLEEYISYVKNPKYIIWILYAQNCYFMEKYLPALEAVELALEEDKTQVNEVIYQLKFTLEYSLQRYAAAIDTLSILVDHYPEKKIYWRQLMGLYLQNNNHEKGLVLAQLNEKLHYLESENEKMNLASLFYLNGIPYLAGKYAIGLTPNLKTLEFAGSAFYHAREPKLAIEAYEKAMKYDDTGKIPSLVAQLYLDLFDYKKAIEYFSLALKKGNVKNVVDILMNRAVCYQNSKNKESAKKDFERVLEIDPANVGAQKWLTFLQQEES